MCCSLCYGSGPEHSFTMARETRRTRVTGWHMRNRCFGSHNINEASKQCFSYDDGLLFLTASNERIDSRSCHLLHPLPRSPSPLCDLVPLLEGGRAAQWHDAPLSGPRWIFRNEPGGIIQARLLDYCVICTPRTNNARNKTDSPCAVELALAQTRRRPDASVLPTTTHHRSPIIACRRAAPLLLARRGDVLCVEGTKEPQIASVKDASVKNTRLRSIVVNMARWSQQTPQQPSRRPNQIPLLVHMGSDSNSRCIPTVTSGCCWRAAERLAICRPCAREWRLGGHHTWLTRRKDVRILVQAPLPLTTMSVDPDPGPSLRFLYR